MIDVCYVVSTNNRNTILDRMAMEVWKVTGGDMVYGPCPLPEAKVYMAMHYTIAYSLVEMGLQTVCLFTHESAEIKPELLNKCRWVICENEHNLLLLKSRGVNESLLRYIPECGDNEAFKPHDRTDDGAILVCGTNYPNGRKNPELLEQVVRLLPQREFILLGKDWGKHSLSHVPYESYPEFFSRASVYLSCSKLEGGGPNSLIEAMHANLIPVVSDTGNARDYIVHGTNGFIFPTDAKAETVAALIERAFKFNPKRSFPFHDIWQTVRDFTWHNYANSVAEYLQ